MPSLAARVRWGAALLLLTSLLSARPASADDVLRYRVTSLGGRMYSYWKFSNASVVLQSGDAIEYDVYLHTNHAGIGGLELKSTNGVYFRDQPGWVDQNGLGGHPATDIRSQAYLKWYHRRLVVPGSMVGRGITNWDAVVDGTYGSYEVPAAMYNNVCIKRGSTVLAWAYLDGNSSLNAVDFNTPSTVQSAHLFPTTVRRGPVQVSAHFFYWHDAPYNNADPNQMVFDPRGLVNTGPWDGYGLGYGYSGYYSSLNSAWWEGAFADVKKAGCDMVDLICWGNHPNPWFNLSVISNYMVPALERSGTDLKIALFDDTTSECCEWNADQGRGYNADTPMPLSNSNNWSYFYDRKIKPFFQAIPKKYWATHNGASVDAGGRPIIITYSAAFFANVNTHGASCWQAIKEAFARDFKNASGAGITPWVVHEISWINAGAGATADSAYTWGAALNGPAINQVNGWYTGSVGPGYDDRLIRSPGNFHARDNGNWLINWYNGVYAGRNLWNCNLVLMETWNELWEGTGIERCVDYTAVGGGTLPETNYIDKFGLNCIGTSIGRKDLDATFTQTWKIPATVTRGSTAITVRVRNDGTLPWTPNPVWMGVWLEDAAGNVIPNTETWIPPSTTVLSGTETAITFTTPAGWPTGSYKLRADMVWNGWTWFRWQGDNAAKVSVSVN
jgi:hypothetical protein